MTQNSPTMHAAPTTASECTRAVGATTAEGSIGIPCIIEGALRVREIASLLHTGFDGDGNLEIAAAAPIESAGPSDVSFAVGQVVAKANQSRAGCLIVPHDFSNTDGHTVIRVEHPRNAFAIILAHLYPPDPVHAGVHETAVIAASAFVDPSCEIGPHVTIAERVRIGRETRIGAGSRNRPQLGHRRRLHAVRKRHRLSPRADR
jgi:UDP-3-O-[3-hydroxymyristoyl] glucosamine N-acyltransferase